MKEVCKALILLGILLIISCSDNSVSSNQDKLIITIEPLQASVNLGDQIQIDVNIDECSIPSFGVCLQIEFDNNILSFTDSTSMTDGDFFGNDNITFVQEENGIIHLAFTLTQNNNPVSGSGTLCSLSFDSTNLGTTEIGLILNEISLYDQEGNLIEFDTIEIHNTEITIM